MIRTVLQDREAVAESACDHILAAADRAVQARGVFRLVLAGGTTPGAAYRLLAAAERDWASWRFYLGDERCLAPDDAARNSVMIRQTLLGPAGIPESLFYEIPAELGPTAAAEAYRQTIAADQPFDLVVLGVGEDGHTASLFPGHAVEPTALVVPVHGAPKPPPERVSLGISAIAAARERLVLVTGAGKSPAVRAWWQDGEGPIAAATAIEPTTVLLDTDAAGV